MASTQTAETRRRTAQFSGSRPWQDQHVDSDRHPRRRDKRELTATTGLAALSLDAMASVAYGPEAIVVVLAAAGGHALGLTLPVSAAIVVLLAVLVLSYRQLIAAFPNGGGAYAVARTYLGRRTSLVAAASLVIDYVLNVAVSVTAGTAALSSAFPAAGSYAVGIALGILAMITLVNLRGVVSSAKTFIIPTGVFVASILSVIVMGLLRGGHTAPQPAPEIVGSVGILLLLKAFANGCAALTGVEAIANATPQFRENRIRRAQRAEVALGGLLGVMMLGIAALVERLHIHPQPGVTVLSQLTESVFGRGALYYVVQIATIVLLGLAANTSFGGLPQLMKVVAGDDHLPQPTHPAHTHRRLPRGCADTRRDRCRAHRRLRRRRQRLGALVRDLRFHRIHSGADRSRTALVDGAIIEVASTCGTQRRRRAVQWTRRGGSHRDEGRRGLTVGHCRSRRTGDRDGVAGASLPTCTRLRRTCRR